MRRRPVIIPAALLAVSSLTIGVALVQAVQIITNSLPLDSLRLARMPISHFTHAVGGAVFGILGPLQFGRVLAGRFGTLHKIMGRIFVLCGLALALSSMTLLWGFGGDSSILVSGGRFVFGLGLGVALILAVLAIRERDVKRHTRWMIRAYAIGMGATVVSLVFIPIYAITGEPPIGVTADLIFIGSWACAIALAEYVVRRRV